MGQPSNHWLVDRTLDVMLYPIATVVALVAGGAILAYLAIRDRITNRRPSC